MRTPFAKHDDPAVLPLSMAPQGSPIPATIKLLFAVDVLLGVLYIISRVARGFLGEPVMNLLDLDKELNLPSWYSTVQLFLIGLLLCVFAASQALQRGMGWWALPAAAGMFMLLSLDEMVGLHEKFGDWLDTVVGSRRGTTFWKTGVWMFVCAPVMLAAVAVIGMAVRRYLAGRRAVVWKYCVGFAVYVVSAAGIEVLSNFVSWHSSKAARLQIFTEEVGEMAGATIILWATYELLRSHGVRLLVMPSQEKEIVLPPPRRAAA